MSEFPQLPDAVWSFINSLREADIPGFIPTCPITMAIPRQPVQSTTSQTTYEYKAIRDHLNHNNSSPTSRQKLSKKKLIPDRTALGVIEAWAREQMNKNQKRGAQEGGESAAEKRVKLNGGGAAAAPAGAAGVGQGEAAGVGAAGAREVIDLADDLADDDGDGDAAPPAINLGQPPAALITKVKVAKTVLQNMMQWFGELNPQAEPSDQQVEELKKTLSRSNRVEKAFTEWVCSAVEPNTEARNTRSRARDTYSRVPNGAFKMGVSAILRAIYPAAT
ncbi:unnamed protein product [Vitrella brassicaformis CCMP3155]|uniref:U-box domain-containing protein n=1 Tax=Vitrella brassicaformis (strain CCMP3155) TaxID=1169540 RepID=A0A0G4FXT1_VITBC|nr:unnamed protein product [Vitrella brassicaformis CCMP3155]|eukprot:CEM19673.1 unnamed protein product [Vitrella brassicaformis CCMP3155]